MIDNHVAQFLRHTAAKLDSRRFYDAPIEQYTAAIVHRAEFLALADELDKGGQQAERIAAGKTVLVEWKRLREIPPGTYGQPRGCCESCGDYLWSDGAYRVDFLPGWYCSVRCVEFTLAQRKSCHWCFADGEPAGTKRRYCGDACRTQAESVPLGDGTRLLRYIARLHPSLHAKVMGSAHPVLVTAAKTCRECGVTLEGKRADSDFCSDLHSKRFRRRQKSTIIEKAENSPDTRAQNKGLVAA